MTGSSRTKRCGKQFRKNTLFVRFDCIVDAMEKSMRGNTLNDKIYEYEAVICNADGKGGAYVAFPYDVRKEFGKGRVKVHALFDGVPYDGSLVRMQTPGHIIGLRKDIRSRINKQPGDTVHVIITERQ